MSIDVDCDDKHESRLVVLQDNKMIYFPAVQNYESFLEELICVSNQWGALGYVSDDYLIRNFKKVKNKLDDLFEGKA